MDFCKTVRARPRRCSHVFREPSETPRAFAVAVPWASQHAQHAPAMLASGPGRLRLPKKPMRSICSSKHIMKNDGTSSIDLAQRIRLCKG